MNQDGYEIVNLIKKIPDPRIKRCQKHTLVCIVCVTFVAGLCGANNWVEVESIGDAIKSWIQKFVPLPFGIPSHDTLGRVFSLICPHAFLSFFDEWVKSVRKNINGEVINFDGKTLRRTKGDKGALHLLNAWSIDNGISFGQLPVDKKTNETKVLPDLIKLLEVKNCILTTDALNTQKTTAKAAVEAKAGYVLPVKNNHPGLLDDIKLFFKEAEEKEYRGIDADNYETLEKGHGRIESRKYYVIDAEGLPDRKEWEGLQSLGKVVRERVVKGKIEKEVAYYLMSSEINAKLLEKCSRGHWGIENQLHWRLDVIFREDESRYRNKIGAQNLSYVRKMALAFLSKDKTVKGGVQSKRLRAAASSEYREYLLKTFI